MSAPEIQERLVSVRPAVPASTVAEISSCTDAPTSSSPTLQMPDPPS